MLWNGFGGHVVGFSIKNKRVFTTKLSRTISYFIALLIASFFGYAFYQWMAEKERIFVFVESEHKFSAQDKSDLLEFMQLNVTVFEVPSYAYYDYTPTVVTAEAMECNHLYVNTTNSTYTRETHITSCEMNCNISNTDIRNSGKFCDEDFEEDVLFSLNVYSGDPNPLYIKTQHFTILISESDHDGFKAYPLPETQFLVVPETHFNHKILCQKYTFQYYDKYIGYFYWEKSAFQCKTAFRDKTWDGNMINLWGYDVVGLAFDLNAYFEILQSLTKVTVHVSPIPFYSMLGRVGGFATAVLALRLLLFVYNQKKLEKRTQGEMIDFERLIEWLGHTTYFPVEQRSMLFWSFAGGGYLPTDSGKVHDV